MVAVSELLYRALVRDEASASLQSIEQKFDAVGASAEGADQKLTRANSSFAAIAKRHDEVSRTAAALAKAQTDLANAQQAGAAAMAAGTASQAQVDRVTAQLAQNLGQAAVAHERARRAAQENAQAMAQWNAVAGQGVGAARALATAMPEMARGTQALGSASGSAAHQVQNMSYQVGDFAVQLASGQSAATALAQQLPQLLGGFGMVGAIAGAAVAIAAATAKLIGMGDAMERINGLAREQEAVQQSLTSSTDLLTKSFEDQRKSVLDLARHYEVLDAAEREYESRRLARARNKILEEQTALGGRAASRAASAAAIARTQVGFGSPDMMPLGGIELDASVGRLDEIVAQLRSGSSTPRELAALGTELDTIARSGAQAATQAARLRDNLDDLVPQARALDQQLSENQRFRDALEGGGTWLTLPPMPPEDGPPDRGSGRSRANPADRADVQGTMEKILLDQERAARSLTASLDPAVAAWQRYEEAIEGVRRASDLYNATIDREGGPLGISPAEAERFQNLAQEQYETSLKRIEEQGNRTGNAMESAFGKATSALEDALVNGAELGDVLKGLEQDFARLIYRMTIMKQMETAGNAASNFLSDLVGNVAGSLFGSGAGGSYDGKGAVVSTSKTTGVSGGAKAFAAGGIMTAFGEMPLRRYGAGGVATSPQLALFGEGRKPEAYVPLQDGRTIPVTVQGGGGVVYSPTIHVDARGADAGVEQRLTVRMQQMIAANQRQFVADMQRGGAMSRAVGRRS
ncbi:hypothetical protein HMPREF9946_02235 [Acetobacteraceae bacterium AT-5844]|nr:hypothetical protein HMPREF9946_02235 [Acetobacteraceae bacterium AT-5844]